MHPQIRIGAVSYLNSRPLVHNLSEYAEGASVVYDVPSRLATMLQAGELDVGLIPSIEYARGSGYKIVPGMAISAHGPVLSVKLYCRVAPERIRTVAMDEGSRTSAALSQILLQRWHGIRPDTVPFPLGMPAEEIEADAVLAIGDRAIKPLSLGQIATFDLGEEWLRLTGLPFVFAMWVVREGVELGMVASALQRAKAAGLEAIETIAGRDGLGLGLSEADVVRYLTEYIRYDLGRREIEALNLFFQWAAELKLAPKGATLEFTGRSDLAAVP